MPSPSETLPEITFSEALPISQKREHIAELIARHQVVILAGETGSGKTTQLPKICLQLGRGQSGIIGHTQPRRIAARTVASRIAEELKVQLGKEVGYQVRFTDHSDETTLIKLMTDGILLAEIRHDPLLKKYDTLIIDEAHERSLNIDFLLGYVKKILPKRPDLKVIVTSATIDLEKFSKHFKSKTGNAPIIEVSGRTYPVELHYAPWQDDFDDVNDAIAEHVEALVSSKGSRGDILVFLSGEREIREASHAIKKRNLAHLQILPLYARLSLAEQNRVFQQHKGRRVVLATNVAETSLTVPGIRYVIDPGTARIKRYSLRTKVQRLPIEAISQASANQRMGRCGRVSDGVCIRLYDKQDFESRPEFTEAEILRSNLAGVVLQMLQQNIGDVRYFPFVDSPDSRLIKDGYRLLEELGAVNARSQISKIGRQLSQFQVDPKLARILLAAKQFSCLSEMLIIVSGLSVQDIRDRPAEKKQQSDEKHRRFWDEQSDFMSYVNVWNYLEEQRQQLSQNQLRKLCQREYLNYLRYREWRDVHHQLRLAIRKLGWKENSSAADYEAIHRAIVPGLLANIGQKNDERGERNYKGTRNRNFLIFPGSSQSKKRPQWLIAAEMLETSQLFAHCVAKVEPAWVIDAAAHVKKVQHYEPHYQNRSGQVMAFQRTLLYGLVLQEKQRVAYGKINPELSRELFIRAALVEGQYGKNSKAKGGFFQHNQNLIKTVLELEARSRRRDIMVDDERLFAFYNERIPENIVNLAGFEHWRKQAEQDAPKGLFMNRSQLMLHAAEEVSEAQFPKTMTVAGISYQLQYHFEPGHPEDGVSINVPVSLLHQLPEGRLEWLVPGMLRDKCIALLKSLPKPLRKKIVPIPQTVDGMLEKLSPGNRQLGVTLAEQLRSRAGEEVCACDWSAFTLDDYYRMNVRVLDEKGSLIDQGRDLLQLRERYRDVLQTTLAQSNDTFQAKTLTRWEMDELESTLELKQGDVTMLAYPVLFDKKNAVELNVHDNPTEAAWHSARGKARLACLHMSPTIKYLQKDLLKGKDILLTTMNAGTRADVVDDILLTAVNQVCKVEKLETKTTFENAVAQGKGSLVDQAQLLEKRFLEVAQLMLDIKKTMKASKNALPMAFAFSDISAQLTELVYKGFLFETPPTWLEHYPRFLKAILIRLEKAPLNMQKDRLQIAVVDQHSENHRRMLTKFGQARYWACEEWQCFRWMIEELRVSLFAQQLKTSMPVSDKRLKKQLDEVQTAISAQTQ